MEFIAKLIGRIRWHVPGRAPRAISVKSAERAADFAPSTAGLGDCFAHDSASKAQELLDAWMEEDRRRLQANNSRPHQ